MSLYILMALIWIGSAMYFIHVPPPLVRWERGVALIVALVAVGYLWLA